jgi:hypothetical protein
MTSAAKLRVALIVCLALVPVVARADNYPPIPPSLTTLNQVETSIGTLKFRDGIPDQATADKLYDQLDLQRGISAFLNGLRGVSIYAARQGIREAGGKDNEGVLIFSGLRCAIAVSHRQCRHGLFPCLYRRHQGADGHRDAA